jgi:hypothetical protein
MSLRSTTYLYHYPLSVVHSTSTTCLALFILFSFQSYIEIIGIVTPRITLLCFLLFLALSRCTCCFPLHRPVHFTSHPRCCPVSCHFAILTTSHASSSSLSIYIRSPAHTLSHARVNRLCSPLILLGLFGNSYPLLYCIIVLFITNQKSHYYDHDQVLCSLRCNVISDFGEQWTRVNNEAFNVGMTPGTLSV